MDEKRRLKNMQHFLNSLRNNWNDTIHTNTDYINMTTNMNYTCDVCNNSWNVKPRTVLEKGCPFCNGSVTRRKTDSEYKKMLKEVHGDNIINVEPYINMNTPILHHCNKHQCDFKAKPMKIYHSKQGCHFCGLEKANNFAKTRRYDLTDFKKEVFESTNGEYICNSNERENIYSKLSFSHFINGVPHDFIMSQNEFKKGNRCPVCKGRQVYVGYNDIHTTNPELGKMLLNHDDGYKYTEWSGVKLDWKCECGNIIYNKRIRDVNNSGLSCSMCSDGISYPNKFIYNLLNQKRNMFNSLEREYSPNWCNFIINNNRRIGRYDLYFEYKDRKYIVEMDGGLGHGNKCLDKTPEETKFIDSEKDRLASEHNIYVIRIDSYYNTHNKYQYIKDKIIHSELSTILDLDIFDFDKANNDSLHSYVLQAIKLWNSNKSVSEIANHLRLSESTILSYLKLGTKSNLCNYSPTESRNRGIVTNSVICIETKKIYPSITEASEKTGAGVSGISKCCRGLQGGTKSSNGIIHWMYYEDYIKLLDISEFKIRKNNNFTKVVCANTGIIFNSMKEAGQYYGIRPGGIQACCAGKSKYSGIDKNTGEKLIWKYYKEEAA